MGAKTTITEKQFLKLSDRKRDQFIERKVYGQNRAFIIPFYTTTWEGMGEGIKHANRKGYNIHLHICEHTEEGRIQCIVQSSLGLHLGNAWGGAEEIKLAFWIAYLKALGIIGEKSN